MFLHCTVVLFDKLDMHFRHIFRVEVDRSNYIALALILARPYSPVFYGAFFAGIFVKSTGSIIWPMTPSERIRAGFRYSSARSKA
jgi:hypothetical protein